MRKHRGKNVPWAVKERAYQLALDGHSYSDIAEIVGMTRYGSQVYRWIQSVQRQKAITVPAEKTIDQGVPFPDRKPQRHYLRLAFKMNEGDSIYFDTPAEGRRMYRAVRDLGFFGRTKTEGMGLRVWKLRDLDTKQSAAEIKKGKRGAK